MSEKIASRKGVRGSPLAELKSLGERGGAAIGDAYALAASAFLHGLERLEDLNAERSFRQRSQASRARPPAAAGLTRARKQSTSTHPTSV